MRPSPSLSLFPSMRRLARPSRTGIAAPLLFLASVLLSSALHSPPARAQASTTATPAPAPGQPQLGLPRLALRAGMYRIDAQLASRPHERQIGLMHRQQMPAHEGMLFAFAQPGVQCFWMKNTLLPLTAAFVADDGRIVNLADMQPLDERSHCSSEPVRFVLEMHQGWFAAKGIQAGSYLMGTIFTAP